MFKSNKNSKATKRPKGDGAALMQQMGFQMPNFEEPNMGADEDDDDDTLEAELRLMQEEMGMPVPKRPKAAQKKPGGSAQELQSFHNDVNKLLGDIDRPINDDELSDGDEEDLLSELHEITGEMNPDNQPEPMDIRPALPLASGNLASTLEARGVMYAKAVETAKTNGDGAKARRLDRQLKVIQEMQNAARTGAPVNESEIPPELFLGTVSSAPVAQQMPPPVIAAPLPSHDEPVATQPASSSLNNVDEAIAHFRTLALQAKSQGDMVKAKEYLIQMKNLQNGITNNPAPAPAASASNEPSNDAMDETNLAMPLTAPEPRTVLEALQQRHEDLTKRFQDATSKGDNAKARRLDRLAKQYQEAIDATRKGRPYDYSELPELPGFAPIPVQQPKPQPPANATAPPVRPSQPSQRSSQLTSTISQPTPTTSIGAPAEQSTQSLRLKREQLQKLALQAKQKGDIETAKKYLLASKEVELKLAVAESSASTETNTASEASINSFEVIRDHDLTDELAQADRDTIFRRLQEDLLRQMQLCARNQQVYAQMEGLANAQQASEFKALEQRCAHDLERLRQAFQHGSKPPAFHYEKRQMNIVQVNNDLTDNDFEVTVLRGINLNVPSGYSAAALQTYVVIEFPYPPEATQTARTRHATGSVNAEYPESLHMFQIKRNDNKCKRLMGRKDLKLSIYYKVGFLRFDRVLGVASVKLAPLEQVATLHESVDVFENDHKKKAEGKLEVKIRIREALGSAKSSQLSSQRWLVIDRFDDIPHDSQPSTSKSPATASAITAISRLVPTGEALGLLAINLAGSRENTTDTVDSRRSSAVEPKSDAPRTSQSFTGSQSIQVLKYEAELLLDQIEQLEEHLTPDQIELLREKHRALKDQSALIVQRLREGGKQALQDHVRDLRQLAERYEQDANDCRQRNDTKKADLLSHKKTLALQEIDTLTN